MLPLLQSLVMTEPPNLRHQSHQLHDIFLSKSKEINELLEED
jgi:hypothetical protein